MHRLINRIWSLIFMFLRRVDCKQFRTNSRERINMPPAEISNTGQTRYWPFLYAASGTTRPSNVIKLPTPAYPSGCWALIDVNIGHTAYPSGPSSGLHFAISYDRHSS